MASNEQEVKVKERVFCMDINGGKPAQLARRVLTVHFVMILFGAVFAGCALMASLQTRAASSKVTREIGNDVVGAYANAIVVNQNKKASVAGPSNPRDASMSAFIMLIIPIPVVVLPILWWLFVRRSIQIGERGLIQGVCYVDGCCSCAIIGIAIFLLVMITSLGKLKGFIDDMTTNGCPYKAYPIMRDSRGATTERPDLVTWIFDTSCAPIMSAASKQLDLARYLCIGAIAALMMLCITCSLGAYKISEAVSMVEDDIGFTGSEETSVGSSIQVGKMTQVVPLSPASSSSTATSSGSPTSNVVGRASARVVVVGSAKLENAVLGSVNEEEHEG